MEFKENDQIPLRLTRAQKSQAIAENFDYQVVADTGTLFSKVPNLEKDVIPNLIPN